MIFVMSALHPDEWARAVENTWRVSSLFLIRDSLLPRLSGSRLIWLDVEQMLKPGGVLLFRDYGRNGTEPFSISFFGLEGVLSDISLIQIWHSLDLKVGDTCNLDYIFEEITLEFTSSKEVSSVPLSPLNQNPYLPSPFVFPNQHRRASEAVWSPF